MKNIASKMKNFFKRGLSSLIKLLLLVTTRKGRRISSMPKSHAGTRNKSLWWNKKRIFMTTGAAVIVIAVVLTVTLSTQNRAEALSDVELAYAASANASQSIVADTFSTNEDTSHAALQNTVTSSGAEVPTSTPETSSTATAVPEIVPTTEPEVVALVRGCHDPRIVEVQEKLMSLGYMSSDEPTDYYGFATWYALQLFQRKHNLGVDGIAGDNTLELLFSDEAKPYTVKLEDSGSDVKEFQDRLRSLNYLKTSSTSYFGTDTEKAVISFQKRNGLDPDGIIGENTLELLNSDSAKEAATSSGGSSSSSGGSSGGSTTHANVYIEGDPTPDALIKYAKTKLGCNYSLGAKGPSSFDCSGFVYYCLNQIGYKIKYMTSSGWTNCDLPKVSKMKNMKAGDIICFTPHHVGIYMGNGRMIDASSGNDEVVIRENIFSSSYWTRHFVCARRIF